VIDGWALKSKWRWSKYETKIVQLILEKASLGTKVYVVAGNHDEFLRKFSRTEFNIGLGSISVVDEVLFETSFGKRYLILHGDKFDVFMTRAKWMMHLGDFLYEALFVLNKYMNDVRWLFGMPYWSLAQYGKDSVKSVINFISKFEKLVTDYARQMCVDGVICGHIHHAIIKCIDGVEYINTGDWVESLTSVVEDSNGRLMILEMESV
jgi:UDP-2,3-diacylglucosamine pyrophosphatase LpxH